MGKLRILLILLISLGCSFTKDQRQGAYYKAQNRGPASLDGRSSQSYNGGKTFFGGVCHNPYGRRIDSSQREYQDCVDQNPPGNKGPLPVRKGVGFGISF